MYKVQKSHLLTINTVEAGEFREFNVNDIHLAVHTRALCKLNSLLLVL